jgi:hypothetical protein
VPLEVSLGRELDPRMGTVIWGCYTRSCTGERAGNRHLGAELGEVDFGGRWTKGYPVLEPGVALAPRNHAPVSTPLGFRFRPLPVLRDSVWFTLGRARGSVTSQGGERMLNSLGSHSSLPVPSLPFSFGHSVTSIPQAPTTPQLSPSVP